MDMEIVLSDDEEETLFLWSYDFYNRNIYRNIFERGCDQLPRKPTLPQIKGEPNTNKLMKSGFYNKVKRAAGDFALNSNLVQLIEHRETGGRHFGKSDKCRANNLFIPNRAIKTVLEGIRQKFYCCKYSADGQRLIVASSNGHITVVDTRTKYSQLHKYFLDQYNHSILDLDVSHDGAEFLCCTWSSCVFISKTEEDDVLSPNYFKKLKLNNTTFRMGVFSAQFSNNSIEVLAASNDGCFYVYSRDLDKRTLRVIQESESDINAVRFLDRTNNNILCGASNDGLIEIWDRRTLNENNPKSVGTFVGHFDGITYLDTLNDGNYLITNSKDQSIKLWDVRKFSKKSIVNKSRKHLANHSWNYLSDNIPTAEFYESKKVMDGDCSLMTFRGHRVSNTLIRAKFSPPETTGQRYIYSGCSTGHIIIYDALTGKIVKSIESHGGLVRDVDWHPSSHELISASFDGKVILNGFKGEDHNEKRPNKPLRRSRRIMDRNERATTLSSQT